MSLTPVTPTNLGQDIKSFWSRPEGKTGMIAVAILAGALVYGWGMIVPFIVSMLADTLHMIFLAVILAAVLFVLFSSRTHLLFRLLMRWLTGLIINIDPIGIFKDHLEQMRKRREVMAQQISNVSGQLRYLKDVIDKNHEMANENMRLAARAKKVATTTADQNEQLRMALQMKAKANQAGRLEKSNLSYQQLLGKLQNIYDLLSKWAVHIDFYIEDTDNEVKQSEIEYKTINSANWAKWRISSGWPKTSWTPSIWKMERSRPRRSRNSTPTNRSCSLRETQKRHSCCPERLRRQCRLLPRVPARPRLRLGAQATTATCLSSE